MSSCSITPVQTPQRKLELKITLKGVRPPIWRRVEAPGTISLADLHQVIQAAMGWHDGHLHQFEVGGPQGDIYGDRTLLEELDVRNERTARLQQVAPRMKDRLGYLYSTFR